MAPAKREGRRVADNEEIARDARASRREARKLVASLEPAEGRALEMIVAGQSLVRVAGELGVTLEAAVLLKARLMKKLGASATADLVRIGVYAQADER